MNQGSDYQPPAWDSWSDTPETYPGADDATLQWSLEDEATIPSERAPQLDEGAVIGGRYLLAEPLAHADGTATWRAFDQKLSRPVLLHLLSATDGRGERVLEAARRAAVATDARFLRVLDAVADDEPGASGQIGTYVVCEFVPGISLEQLLASGPLSALEAAWVTREIADALDPVHAQGMFHQRLNPDTIIITATGNVKIVGLLIEQALRPDEAGGPDVRDIGKLLYAMLVNRWPADGHDQSPHWGLASAPRDANSWLTPRQVRAGVSPALDQITDQLLNDPPRTGREPITDAATLDQALSRVLGTADASADLEHRVRNPPIQTPRTTELPAVQDPAVQNPAVQAPISQDELREDQLDAEPDDDDQTMQHDAGWATAARPQRRRTWLWLLVITLVLVLICSLVATGLRNRSQQAAASPTPSATAPTTITITKVADFDPKADGGNGEELPDEVANVTDGKPGTAWHTMRYKGDPKLGGLKPGVGLVLDLGRAQKIGSVQAQLQGSPTAIQLRVPKNAQATSAPMDRSANWTVVASNDKAGTSVTLTPSTPTTTRFLLVYLTSLPKVDQSGYRGAITEVQVCP